MRPQGFMHGVLVAAALASAAGLSFALFSPWFGAAALVHLLVPALALAYIAYLLSRCEQRTGRVATLSVWTVVSTAAWWVEPSLPLLLALHLGMIWLIRSLYFYSSGLSALGDLALNVVSAAAAAWALSRTGSLFLATWSLFLVQALYSAIPERFGQPKGSNIERRKDSSHFDRAKQQADRALRQLACR